MTQLRATAKIAARNIRALLRAPARWFCGLPPHYGWTTLAREEALWLSLDYIQATKREGDYAEFGVWRGDTLSTALRMSRRFSIFAHAKFRAFDSFEGFPELSGDDVHPQFQTGGRAFDLEAFYRLLERRGLSRTQVPTYKGWFSETLAFGGAADLQVPDDSLAIAWIDCDLYESTKDALPFILKKLRSGGIALFDDWYCFDGHPMKGEQRATREFLAAHPSTCLLPFARFGWHGAAFILHKDLQQSDTLEGFTDVLRAHPFVQR